MKDIVLPLSLISEVSTELIATIAVSVAILEVAVEAIPIFIDSPALAMRS